jgi:3-hydroxyacyl-CoA dehydrogenase
MVLTLSAIENRPVVVLGGGVLGRRIACTWAAGGWQVRIQDPNAEQRTAALHYVESNIASYASIIGSIPGKVSAHEDLAEAVKDAWTVIEAVPEKLPLKISIFADLEKLAPRDAILASNSSSYKSSDIIERVGSDTKERIMNTHYMMPPDNRVVELMTDGQTDPEIFPFYVERLREVGMHPIVAKRESTGFVFNRVWAAIKREFLTILAEGVSTPEELDRVWVEVFGGERDVGPCAMMDAVGLDTVASIEQHYIKERGLEGGETVDFLDKNYLSQGKLGAKSGKGGLYPPGHTTRAAGEERHSHENLHAPSL